MTLRLEEVSFVNRGRTVLDGVSLEVPVGRLTCVVGPNGAGKTTLLRVLSGEWKPARGRYFVGAVDASRLSQKEVAGRVSIIPQGITPPPYLKVSELVELGRFRPRRPIWGRPSREDAEAVRASLARCQAAAISGRAVEDLSGGEQQRAWLAFGLAQGKDFLLLDETLDGLDVFAKRAFLALLAEVAAGGTGIALTTHDLALVSDYADRVIALAAGKVVYEGPPGVDLDRCFLGGPGGRRGPSNLA